MPGDGTRVVPCPKCGFKQEPGETCIRCGEELAKRQRGALFWLGVVFGAVVLLCGGGAGVLVLGVVNSEASDIAETFVVESADVRKALGGEPEVAWWREGSITTHNRVSGTARFVLTATGPKGEAKIVVELQRAGDAWGISKAGIVGAGGSVSELSRERVKK